MAPRPARLVPGLLVLSLLTLAACDGSGSDDRAGPAATAGSPASTTTAATPASTASPTTGAPAWSTAARTGPGGRQPPDGPSAKLGAIRAARHPGYDRVVFQFEGAEVPGYRIEYVREIPLGESDDQYLTLQGEALVQATFQGSAREDYRPETQTAPDRLTPGLAQVKQIGLAEDWEGVVRVGVGLDHRGGFRVLELHDPTRVVVDFAT
jgi:hypothetical protein